MLSLGFGAVTGTACGDVIFGEDQVPRDATVGQDGGADAGPRDSSPTGDCIPQDFATPEAWPFKDTAAAYRKVFPASEAGCALGGSCHGVQTGSPPFIPPAAQVDTLYASSASALWGSYTKGGSPAPLSAEGTSTHAMWAHDRDESPPFGADDVAMVDSFISYARSCAIASTTTWKTPLCSATDAGATDAGTTDGGAGDAGCYCAPPDPPKADYRDVCKE